jgi:DNA replication licensing factor MCM7
VIRASEVRPLLSVATYSCDSCSAETFQPIPGPSFTPLISCNSEFCKSNRTGGRLQLQTRGSKFTRFQEIKIQEQSADVPAGHVPRCLTVHCKGENTRKVTAGDHVAIAGVFLPLAKSTAFAQITQGLLTDTFLEAHVSYFPLMLRLNLSVTYSTNGICVLVLVASDCYFEVGRWGSC